MKKILLSLLFTLLFINSNVFAATYYAITTGGNWSSSATWASSTGQSVGGAGVPTAADTVNIDSTLTNVSTVTVDNTSAVALTLNATGAVGTLSIASGKILTVSGNVTFGSGMTITGTGTLIINNTSTITPNGVTFPGSLTWGGTVTYTLGGDLIVSGTCTNYLSNTSRTIIISGAHNMTCGTLYLVPSPTSSLSFTFPASQTFNITTALTIPPPISPQTYTIKSGTSSTAFNLNYTGLVGNIFVIGATLTDINASGSNQEIYNYDGGTLTRTINITNVNNNNIGGVLIQ